MSESIDETRERVAREMGITLPRARAMERHSERTLANYAWLKREREIATESPETMREAVMYIGAPEYARGVIEAMRHRGSECPLCRARAMSEWAFKSFERVARWAGAGSDVIDALARALGVTLDLAKVAVGAYQQVQGMDAAQAADFSLARLQEHYAAQGKHLVLLDGIEPGGSDPAGTAPALPTAVPGSNHATEGGNGNGTG